MKLSLSSPRPVRSFRKVILDSDVDRVVYLNLLRENIEQHKASLMGYCLMSNHVHLVMIPRRADSLALAMKHTHGRYASYWNAKHNSSGHLWQGRYYSCPLDQAHLREALRYTELNPVRAGLVEEAELWRWSSAGVHCGVVAEDGCLEMAMWRERWDIASWKLFLAAGMPESELETIRQYTHTGRPLGSEEFVRDLEEATQRSLAPQKGGRPARFVEDVRQSEFTFEL